MGVTTFLPGADAINEGATGLLGATLLDASGAAINGASVLTLVATLKSAETEAVINNRSDQTVLNANGGSTVSGAGVWSLTLGAPDTALVSGESALGKRFLKRRLTVEGTYNDSGTPRPFNEEITFYVRSLVDVG